MLAGVRSCFQENPERPVFPDGKRIIYSQVDQYSSDLYLVEDFR